MKGPCTMTRWAALAFLAASGCGSTENHDPDAPALVRVDVIADAISPDLARVRVGGRVHWSNMDNKAHHLVARAGTGTNGEIVFDSDVLLSPAGFQPFTELDVTFSTAGEVSYGCTSHPGTLIGRVIVVE